MGTFTKGLTSGLIRGLQPLIVTGGGGGPPPPSPEDQRSIRFVGNATGAELAFNLGGLGHTDFVIETLIYFEGKSSFAVFFGARHLSNGRYVTIQCNNTFEVYDICVGDSQTGTTAWATQPPLNTWLHVTLQSTASAGGTLRATWALAEGEDDTRYEVTRTNGVESSVQAQAVFIGGLALGNGDETGVRFQHFRARTGYLDDSTVASHRQSTDTTGWDFWWYFDDTGSIPLRDLTCNDRIPTQTGGTLESGPVVLSLTDACINVWPTTATALAAILPNLGEPSHIWALGTIEVETMPDLVGSADMVLDDGTGIANIPASNTNQLPDKRALTFSSGANGRFGVADAAVGNPGTNSWCMLEVRRIGDSDAQRYLTDKKGTTGWTVQQLSGDNIRLNIVDSDITTQNIASTTALNVGTDYVIIYGVDRVAGEGILFAHDGSTAVSTTRAALTATASHSASAGVPLRWGKPNSGTSAPSELLYAAYFEGTAAEGVTINDAEAFAQHLKIDKFPKIASNLAAVTPNLGEPSYIWPITETSGNLIDSIAAQILTSGGTPSYQASVGFPTKRSVAFDTNSEDRFGAADPFFQVGTQSFGFLMVLKLDDSSSDKYIWRKLTGSSGVGLIVRSTEALRVTLDDGVNPAQLVTSVPHAIGTYYVLIFGVDRNSGNVVIYSHDGTAAVANVSTALTATGSLTNADDFYFGATGTAAAGYELVYAAAYLGPPFEGVTIDDASAFAQHIGIGSVLPTTAAGWAAVTTNLGEPTHLWLINETSGNLSDSVGSATLTAGGTPTYVFGPGAERAIHLDEDTSDRFSISDTAVISPGTNSYGFVMVFKADDNTAARQFVRKFNGSNHGQSMLLESSERFTWRVGDGTTLISIAPAHAHTIGDWYVAAFGVDRTNSGAEVGVYSYNGTTGAVGTASLGAATGSHTYTGAGLSLGFTSNCAGVTIAAFAYYQGTAWEGVSQQDCIDISNLLGL